MRLDQVETPEDMLAGSSEYEERMSELFFVESFTQWLDQLEAQYQENQYEAS